MSRIDINGVSVLPGCLDRAAQQDLVAEVREICRVAPLVQLSTARGQKMSVRTTSAGQFGWVSNRLGHAYAPRHPSGVAWPAIPDQLLALWDAVAGASRTPESCLINFYGEKARLGLHQDKDEADLNQPVLSISLGDDGLFRVGGTERGGPTRSIWLQSGDVVVLGGAGRLAYHGVDRIRFGSSALLRQGGRLNITMRVVT